jgi:uncharacterized repeat protein (TIGR01451 family)
MKMRHHIPLMVLASATLLSSHSALAQFSQQGPKLVATFIGAIASQGESVSVSADGNTAIVGGPNDNSNAGAAWVWTRDGGGVWTQQAKLVGTGAIGPYGIEQGQSVSLSADGNTAIVGGPGDNNGAGAAWVWTRSGVLWTQQTKLVGTGAAGPYSGLYNEQGYSVSLSADGNTAIVGGPGVNAGFEGAAWVWTRSGGVWTQQGSKLVGSGAVGGAQQGESVALSGDGNTAIVGGFTDNSSAGAAWIWTRSVGVWTQQGSKLVGSGAVDPAIQGISVSLSGDGNTAIVGGPQDDSNGAAWIWTRDGGGVWTQQGSKRVGWGNVGNASQGQSVSLSADGNTALVGGFRDGYGNGDGAAWVWTRSGVVWTQLGAKLHGSGASAGTQQGYSVALSGDGNTAILGGPNDNGVAGVAGSAWVFAFAPVTTTYTAPSATGTGNITAAFTGGGAGCTYVAPQYIPLTGNAASPPAGSAPAGVPFPQGLIAFTASGCTPGSVLSFTITYPQALPAGTQYWKYGPTSADATPHWYTLPTAVVIGNTVTFSITDGGLGDDDLIATNGIIVDPGGPAAPAAVADLTIIKSHTGNFRQGDTGDTYTITVTNSGSAATSGTVTVTDTLPAGLTPTAPNGVVGGWSCSISGQTLTCTRSDVLASGASYPAITLTVNVANNAAASLVNTASVSGGGEINAANDAANDPTTVNTVNAVNAAPIPAASEWALMALAGMLALLGVIRIRV